MITNRAYRIIWLEKVDSTSLYVSGNIEKLGNLTVIAAEEQTCGRGQGGHIWLSEPGKNLTFSILIKYDGIHRIEAGAQQILTMAASLSVIDFLWEGFGIEAGIKMPNDIYAEGRKICGMLIENGIRGGNMEWSIIGIGINVNQDRFSPELPDPVSIRMITGKRFDTKKCLTDFMRHFIVRFDAIWSEQEALSDGYQKNIISSLR